MRTLTGLMLTLALAGCASSGGGVSEAPAKTLKLDGLQTMAGERVDVDAALAKGEHVALVFWQTWCGSCKSEAPQIVQAQREHGDTIRFLGVIPGKDETVDDAEVEATVKAWGYAFPQIRDRDLALTRGLGVTGTPTVIVLAKDREVLYDAHRPPDDWTRLAGAPRGGDELSLPEGECKDGVCPLTADEGKQP